MAGFKARPKNGDGRSESGRSVHLPSESTGEIISSISCFIKLISLYKPLSADEIKRLINICRDCNIPVEIRLQNRQTVVLRNLRLVWQITKKICQESPVEHIDELQEGVWGLSLAVDKFEPALGHQFSTYATWWIRGKILEYRLRNFSMFSFSLQVQRDISSVFRCQCQFQKEGNGRPTKQQLAETLGWATEKVGRILRYMQQTCSVRSLDQEPGGGDSMISSIKSLISDSVAPNPEAEAISNGAQKCIRAIMTKVLGSQEQEILMERFGISINGTTEAKTIQTIGKERDLSEARVKRVITVAMKKLRSSPELMNLVDVMYSS